MKILIIEDEELLARALGRAAKIRGHEAVIAYNGVEALRRMKAEKFDAVLSDLMLPGMTGVDIYQQAPENMRKRFVFETGTDSGSEREQLNALGRPVLTKPASNDEIFDALTKAAQEAL